MSFPVEVFQEIARLELLAAPLSSVYGGWGWDGSQNAALALLSLLKELGRGNLCVGRVYEGHVNALQLIQTFGTTAQIERWASDARDEQLTFAVWNTEGINGVRITPQADGRFRLDGAKTFASGAGYVRRPIVTGMLPDGDWQMCVVPIERVSVSIDPTWWQPLGMRGSASYKVDFSGVVLEADDLLGAPGDYHRQPWLSGGAIRFAAVQLGGAEALLDATRSFLHELERTGDPYQQARIGEGAILLESGNLWLRAAAERVDLGPGAAQRADSAKALAYAAMTRTAIETICLEIIRIAERSAGARALLHPHPVERIVRDLTLYLRQPAPDAALASVGAFVLNTPAPAGTLWADA